MSGDDELAAQIAQDAGRLLLQLRTTTDDPAVRKREGDAQANVLILDALAKARPQGSYEYQMLFGIRPREQRRLADAGETVRVYVPYGDEWYGYLMRRLAERPANLAFFLRALASRS